MLRDQMEVTNIVEYPTRPVCIMQGACCTRVKRFICFDKGPLLYFEFSFYVTYMLKLVQMFVRR